MLAVAKDLWAQATRRSVCLGAFKPAGGKALFAHFVPPLRPVTAFLPPAAVIGGTRKKPPPDCTGSKASPPV